MRAAILRQRALPASAAGRHLQAAAIPAAQRSAGAAAVARARGPLVVRWLSSAEAEWTVALTEFAAQRIHSASPESPLLRLGVESGGCSGFSYKFEIEDVVATDKDRVFERDGAQLVVDALSLEYVKGATVDFTVEMIGETFEVKDNPNSDGECGCGVSFTPT